jgi:hypothetical protein
MKPFWFVAICLCAVWAIAADLSPTSPAINRGIPKLAKEGVVIPTVPSRPAAIASSKATPGTILHLQGGTKYNDSSDYLKSGVLSLSSPFLDSRYDINPNALEAHDFLGAKSSKTERSLPRLAPDLLKEPAPGSLKPDLSTPAHVDLVGGGQLDRLKKMVVTDIQTPSQGGSEMISGFTHLPRLPVSVPAVRLPSAKVNSDRGAASVDVLDIPKETLRLEACSGVVPNSETAPSKGGSGLIQGIPRLSDALGPDFGKAHIVVETPIPIPKVHVELDSGIPPGRPKNDHTLPRFKPDLFWE